MEEAMLTVLSFFAFLGMISIGSYFFRHFKTKTQGADIKLLLYIPANEKSKLEGLVRQIFMEEIPEKLMTDGKVYLMMPPGEPEVSDLIENLKKTYPLELLPDLTDVLYDTGRTKDSNL
mgnify:FL=1